MRYGPTQIIRGKAYTIATVRTAQVLARRIPHAQLKTIPGIGHTPMEAAPEQFLVLLNGAPAPVTAARRRLSFATSPMHRAAGIRPA